LIGFGTAIIGPDLRTPPPPPRTATHKHVVDESKEFMQLTFPQIKYSKKRFKRNSNIGVLFL
jgi:hypothetical protein